MPVPTELLNLIERFRRNLDQYKQKQYNETQYELSEEEIAVVEGRK